MPVLDGENEMKLRQDIDAIITEVGALQASIYYGGKDSTTAELLGHAFVWLQNLHSRAESAEQAIKDAMSRVPWIDHDGHGDPPRDFPDYVQVRFRDGDEVCGVRWDWDQNWSWGGSAAEHSGDIVAYRALTHP